MSYTKTRKIEAYLDPLESNEGDMRRKEYTLRHSTSTKKLSISPTYRRSHYEFNKGSNPCDTYRLSERLD